MMQPGVLQYIGGRSRARNPFRFPRPALTYQPFLAQGNDTVHHRTAWAADEIIQSRVARWFQAAHDALPAGTSREDMVASVYGIRGWQVIASLATVYNDKWPGHGWVFTHPTDGILIYADKARDGDRGPDYVAPTSGPWGGLSRTEWAADLADFMVKRVDSHPSIVAFPQIRTTLHLLAAAYHVATPEEQAAVALLVGLDGGDLSTFLDVYTHDGTRYPTTTTRA